MASTADVLAGNGQVHDGQGYDPRFLPVAVPLPAPVPGSAPVALVELPYTHFTVLLRPDRRLAAVTAVNMAGDQAVDLVRGGDRWALDDRAPREAQAGGELYARNDLDRGHLVRRLDPVWGEPEVAERADRDTFHYTNAAPQASRFNQSKELWLGLEDYLLEHADTWDLRLSVFSGPVLAPDDPVYRGVAIPRRFWKVAAWSGRDGLAATAYLLDQTPMLDDLERARPRGVDEPPPLGEFRTFQVPVADVAGLTELDLGDLPGADRLARQRTREAPRWRPLRSSADLVV